MGVANTVVADLTGYVNRVATLLRLDAELLSIEAKQKLVAIAVAVGLLAGALLVTLFGLGVLLAAIVLALIQLGLNPALSALLVAVVLFAAGALMAFLGMRRLSSWSLTPHRTLAQFRANIEALRMSMRHEPTPNR